MRQTLIQKLLWSVYLQPHQSTSNSKLWKLKNPAQNVYFEYGADLYLG